MTADPYPELSSNDEWRVLMVAGRKERKWTQDELAERIARRAKLTATQALISQIESGKITNSRLIRPISEELSIPEPMHFTDEKMKQWWLAGHLMRGKDMALFKSQLDAVQATLKALGINPQPVANDGDSDDAPKPSRK